MDSDDFFAAEEQYGEDSAKTAAEAILNDDYEQLRDDDLKEGFLYVTKHVAAVKKEMIERGLLVKPEKGVAYQFPKRPSRQLSQLQQSRKRNDIRKKADKVMLAAMDSGALGFVYGIIYPDAVTEGCHEHLQEDWLDFNLAGRASGACAAKEMLTQKLEEDASAASIEDLLAEFSKAELAGFASLLAPFWQPPFSAKGGPPPWWPKELAFVDKLEKLRVKEAEAVLPAMLENVVRNHVPKAIRNAGWRVKGLINILLNKAVEALRGELEGGAENQEETVPPPSNTTRRRGTINRRKAADIPEEELRFSCGKCGLKSFVAQSGLSAHRAKCMGRLEDGFDQTASGEEQPGAQPNGASPGQPDGASGLPDGASSKQPDGASPGQPDGTSGQPDGAASGQPDGAPSGQPDGAPRQPDEAAFGQSDGAASGQPDGPPPGQPDGVPKPPDEAAFGQSDEAASGQPDGTPSGQPDGAPKEPDQAAFGQSDGAASGQPDGAPSGQPHGASRQSDEAAFGQSDGAASGQPDGAPRQPDEAAFGQSKGAASNDGSAGGQVKETQNGPPQPYQPPFHQPISIPPMKEIPSQPSQPPVQESAPTDDPTVRLNKPPSQQSVGVPGTLLSQEQEPLEQSNGVPPKPPTDAPSAEVLPGQVNELTRAALSTGVPQGRPLTALSNAAPPRLSTKNRPAGGLPAHSNAPPSKPPVSALPVGGPSAQPDEVSPRPSTEIPPAQGPSVATHSKKLTADSAARGPSTATPPNVSTEVPSTGGPPLQGTEPTPPPSSEVAPAEVPLAQRIPQSSTGIPLTEGFPPRSDAPLSIPPVGVPPSRPPPAHPSKPSTCDSQLGAASEETNGTPPPQSTNIPPLPLRGPSEHPHEVPSQQSTGDAPIGGAVEQTMGTHAEQCTGGPPIPGPPTQSNLSAGQPAFPRRPRTATTGHSDCSAPPSTAWTRSRIVGGSGQPKEAQAARPLPKNSNDNLTQVVEDPEIEQGQGRCSATNCIVQGRIPESERLEYLSARFTCHTCAVCGDFMHNMCYWTICGIPLAKQEGSVLCEKHGKKEAPQPGGEKPKLRTRSEPDGGFMKSARASKRGRAILRPMRLNV